MTAAAYGQALTEGQVDHILPMLSQSAVFQSPFSLFEQPKLVRRAFQARAIAFTELTIGDTVDSGSGLTMLRWDALVRGQHVEGAELLTLSGQGIDRIDVFLRPAAVLPTVHAAMTAAWPSR